MTYGETWRGEAEVEELPIATGLAGEAARPFVALSRCGTFQLQDEPLHKGLAVAQPEGAMAEWDVLLYLLRGTTHMAVKAINVRALLDYQNNA